MKVIVERFKFKEGVIERIERDVDDAKVLAGNALFQKLKRESAPGKDSA